MTRLTPRAGNWSCLLLAGSLVIAMFIGACNNDSGSKKTGPDSIDSKAPDSGTTLKPEQPEAVDTFTVDGEKIERVGKEADSLQELTVTYFDEASPLAAVVKTGIYRVDAPDVIALLQNSTHVKQIRFGFKKTGMNQYEIRIWGAHGGGGRHTNKIKAVEIKKITLTNLNIRKQRLNRGQLRKLIDPALPQGPIDPARIRAIYLQPYKREDGLIGIKVSIEDPTKAVSFTDEKTNPIPPSPPGCDPDCDM